MTKLTQKARLPTEYACSIRVKYISAIVEINSMTSDNSTILSSSTSDVRQSASMA